MKARICRALCALGLVMSSTAALAAEPVDVTIYIDKSFRDQWGPVSAGGRTKATEIFNGVKDYYKTNHNVDLRLSRVEAPFFTVDTAQDGSPTTAGTILNIMRNNISVPSGHTATAHPSYWLLVHRDTGTGLAGRVDSIGGISRLNKPYLWISTLERARPSASNPFGGVCTQIPAAPRTAAAIRKTAIHEFGHLMAAQHLSSACSNSVMCTTPAAECIGGLQDPVWQFPSSTDVMDQTNKNRVNAHRSCYLEGSGIWLQCHSSGVP